MKFYLLLICFLATGATLYARQEMSDYAVSNNGDTLRGKHRKNFMNRRIMVTDTGKVNIKATDYSVLYIGKDSAFYKSIKVGGLMPATYWFQRIVAGPIELYTYTFESPAGNGMTLSNSALYAIKGGSIVNVYGEGLGANKKGNKEDLKRLLEDEPEIHKALEESRGLKYDAVVEIIEKYNKAVLEKKTAAK